MNVFSDQDRRFMEVAIAAARRGVEAGQSPFGACIVQDDKVVVSGHNRVVLDTDITAHGEIQTIRAACIELGTIDLSGCTIFSTCEPCPMCFAACHWARLDRIVYGATIGDANGAGFNELTISNFKMRDLGGCNIKIDGGCLEEENKALFLEFISRPGHVLY